MLQLWLRCSLALLSFATSLASAEGTTIPLFVRPEGSTSVLKHGSITYSPDISIGSYAGSDTNNDFSGGKACVGIKDVTQKKGNSYDDFQCLAYGDVEQDGSGHYTLHISPDDENIVLKLDYTRAHKSHKDKKTTGETTNASVTIVRPEAGPVPQLKEPIKLVDNKVPEQEVEKSFIQKYWIYIVPVLLFMMVGGGGGGQ